MSITATPHIGRKITRIRELRGMKQETLASELGVSQQTVSHMEQSQTLDDEKLEKVAKVLGVTPETIKNFSEEKAINYFNNFYDSSLSNGAFNANHCTFNPLDKLIDSYEENKRLYERLLAAEKEKVIYLEKLLDLGKK